MAGALQVRWDEMRRWRASLSRVGRICFWLLVAAGCSLFLRAVGFGGGWTLAVLCFWVLVPLLCVSLLRRVSRTVLWSVRNRLILTYLLMGLAPLLLFGVLAGLVAYVVAGQYAINTALASLDGLSGELKAEESALLPFLVAHDTKAKRPFNFEARANHHEAQTAVASLQAGSWRAVAVTTPHGTLAVSPFAGLPQPSWLYPGFHGLILLQGQLYLCEDAGLQTDAGSAQVLSSLPLEAGTLGDMANHLGRVLVFPGFTRLGAENSDLDLNLGNDEYKHVPSSQGPNTILPSLGGGSLAPAAHLVDPRVYFTAPLPVRAWDTGKSTSFMLVVVSRPSLLYERLFATSTDIGRVLRIVLAALAASFALLEALAFLLAIRLSRTVTRSVAELYRGTREVDGGNLAYRVNAKRRDQFGELALSFNSMAGSMQQLLVEQREKDRLLSELAIAQGVQNNLFPHSPVELAGLHLHAVCIPARTVGGDYFDFIFSGNSQEAVTCLALGDISGKGISAALLMASLHSAVRAFHLDDEGRGGAAPSPASLLARLNRHLYRSTQPERYATLFLAFYDPGSRRLTYSNGGHLPPLLFSPSGEVRRLTCGGSVVGLLDGLEYEEETLQLQPGDLLLAYSDGMTEPENDGIEFGEERLLALVRGGRTEELPVLATKTFRAVQTWIGSSEQPDDMTLFFARML